MTERIEARVADESVKGRERRVTLAGSYNFRDIGGYATVDGRQTVWGRLFRSDGLHRLTAEDVHTVQQFGIRTVFDLRSSAEVGADGLGPLYESGEVVHAHVPFFNEPELVDPRKITAPLAELYARMLEQAQPSIGKVFATLAAGDSYSALIHCAAGKDRTGVMVALILRAIGVSDEDVIADYALTDGYITAWLETAARANPDDDRLKNVPPHLYRAMADTMEQTLTLIDERHGSTEGYLTEVGVTPEQIERVRDALLV